MDYLSTGTGTSCDTKWLSGDSSSAHYSTTETVGKNIESTGQYKNNSQSMTPGASSGGSSGSNHSPVPTPDPAVAAAVAATAIAEGAAENEALWRDQGTRSIQQGKQTMTNGNSPLYTPGNDYPYGTDFKSEIESGMKDVTLGDRMLEAGKKLVKAAKVASVVGIGIQAAEVTSEIKEKGLVRGIATGVKYLAVDTLSSEAAVAAAETGPFAVVVGALVGLAANAILSEGEDWLVGK